MHDVDPKEGEKVFSGHGKHSDPNAEVYVPGEHCTHEDAPARDDDPGGQIMQNTDPAEGVYCPIGQGVHS